MPDSDVELMLRCRKGDRSALAELVGRHEHALMNFFWRMVGNMTEAEDLCQDTFLRVLRSSRNYEPKAAFTTWLFKIARNLCIDKFKRAGSAGGVSLDDASADGGEDPGREPVSPAPTPLDEVEGDENARLVRGALKRLSPKKREVLMMRVYLGMQYSEIAEIVGAPLGTVKYRIHDALKDLSEIMGAISR